MPPPPSSFALHTALLATGQTYSYLDLEGASPDAPTLLLLHGFPDSWYGWKNLFVPWGRQGRGYRLVVPSMLGYSGTAAPKADLAAYTPRSIASDLVSLLDHLELQTVFVVGHDWGAVVAWRMLCWFPERVRGMCSLSIPYSPPSREFLSHEEMAKRVPQLGYMAYFDEASATKEIEANITTFLKSIFQSGVASVKKSKWTKVGGLREILLDQDASRTLDLTKEGYLLDDEHEAFRISHLLASGLDGPLNYYRSHPLRHVEELSMPPPPPNVPTLHLAPLLDPTSAPVALARAKKFVPGLEIVKLPGVGHWVLLEEGENGWRRVEREVGEWVGRVVETERREKRASRGKL